jgi:hypothetical protein
LFLIAAAQPAAAGAGTEVEALERQWLASESDPAVLDRILADDFVHAVSAGVFLDKRQHIGWSARHPRPAGQRAEFETLDVRVFGDAAVATGVVRTTDASGAARRSIFTDVFVHRQGAWRAVSAQETAVETR